MRVEYHPSTVGDVNEAAEYYQQARPGLDDEFRREVDAAIGRISENPLMFPVVRAEIRRGIVHRFPYSILFRLVASDCLRVLVIRHHKRRPGFGLARK